MPSIPQSLLWISLVVLWLFVLVPMLISKRDAVRRTSDVALATRVLTGGAGARLLRRTGPAAGHRSDPHWRPGEDWEHEAFDGELTDVEQDQDADDGRGREAVVVPVADTGDDQDAEADEPDYLDVDVVDEDSAAPPAGGGTQVTEPALLAVDCSADTEEFDTEEFETVAGYVVQDAGHDGQPADQEQIGEYEFVEDSSGLEAEQTEGDDDEPPVTVTAGSSRWRRYDTKTAAAVSARKYVFRKRVLMTMAVVLVGSATAAFEVTPLAWWVCGSATAVTVLYLAYLRRQTRIEEKVRRRRLQRVARARVGVENDHDRDYDVVPSRLRRPGAVVLEIDDGDPIFEHLDDPESMRGFGWPRDLPRAVGQ
ncbi:gephyrin-like molybdotransferase receptor GlpR [Mycobacterium sp.]|uniref:divisome protein SepX/GlpR n=1 Tax=Mycobacterium sp. TaxID=1785 RepID=UPI003BAB9CF6